MTQTSLRFLTLLAVLVSTRLFALEVGEFAPCVVLDDIQTDNSTISQCIRTPKQKGEFVVIDFGSPKCDTCVEELGTLSQLGLDIAATATTRLVAGDDERASLLQFVQDHRDQIKFPVSIDADSDAKRGYGVTALPTLFVLNRKNFIVYKHVGALTPDVVAAVKAAVK